MADKLQFFDPTGAEKAFVYQQTQDLVSFLNSLGPVSVLFEKYSRGKGKKDTGYAITFILGGADLNLKARSQGQDLMEVCISAKNEMKKKMSLITQSIEDSPQRDKLIEELKKFPYIQ